jgi:type II secretory pathway component PulF
LRVDFVSTSGSVSLEQLIALSDEMSALVRSGVPLDRGLVLAGGELRGRAGALASRLGERLERGEGLDAALSADGRAVPVFYRAVIEAGVRTGRLSTALEGLAAYGRSLAETRRAIGLALLYPLMVVLLAYGLFIGFIVFIAPRLSSAFATFHLTQIRSLAAFEWFGEHLVYWVPILPVILIILSVAWLRSGRAATLRPGRLSGLLRLVPGLRSMLALAQTADFADLLSLMIENGVPLDQGVDLAAEAAGAPALRNAAAEIAEGVRRGDALTTLAAQQRGLPPMLAWVLATTAARGPLASALRHTAATYRRRAARRAEAMLTLLPTILICVVGFSAAAVYAASVFQPVITLWFDLATPGSD